MMHVIDAVLDSFADLFRSHRYPPVEKFYSVVLFTTGLSLREMKDRKKRFYNNVNSKKLKSVEDSERSSADLRSRKDRKEGNTNLTIPLSTEVGKMADLTGPGNRDGVPVSGEKSPVGPKGRIGSTDESRRRGAEASRMREVVLLDFPWEWELPPAGRWAESSIAPPPEKGAAGSGARP
jgi:hypothetical protein